MQENKDKKYMEVAVLLAQEFNPAPNPRVGCILVKKGKIISKGAHQSYGGDHAEIEALKKAGAKARGATMYLTLEPCSTYGKTPPCVEAIIKAGVKEAIIGARDPNLKNNQGIEILRKNKIKTKLLNNQKAKQLINDFTKFFKRGLPFVALKIAASLDGQIALENGKSQWITNQLSRQHVQKLRSDYQAILTTSATIEKDNPRLTCRIKGKADPIRIILDSDLKIPGQAKVFKDGNVIVVAADLALPKKIEKYKKNIIDIKNLKSEKNRLEFFTSLKKKKAKPKILICETKNKKIDLADLMKKLAKIGIMNILIEAGARLNTNLIKEKLVDKIYWFMAPKIMGQGINAVNNLGFKSMQEALKLKDAEIKNFENDILIEGYL